MSTAKKRSGPLLTLESEWSFELIDTAYDEIAAVANDFGLDTYANQIEVITSEQMLDAYARIGMPIGYNHWSFGKHFIMNEQRYNRGQMGLAYEMVINSSPCIAYLMEENSMMMQCLVIAHACFGHNSFFKGNYLFQTWTDAEAIIDYLVFARNYIAECEQRHGESEVEELLDSCHALMNYGVDRYKRPSPISLREEKRRQEEREAYLQSQVNDLWRTTIPQSREKLDADAQKRFPTEPEENILYFVEKNAPLLQPWQREVVRIVRKLGRYFYPQRQTQVMNEGWATFWHYAIMNRLYDKGVIGEGFMLEFLHSHTNVVYQPSFDSPYFSGINPYALGFAMYTDIKRICERPEAEDRVWFPEIAGSDWRATLDFAMRNYKDESFVAQYLSPRLMRQFRLFAISDEQGSPELGVSAIHDENGYRHLRQVMSNQYNLSINEPDIQVWSVDMRGDRALTLRYTLHDGIPLAESYKDVMKHLHRLWGFTVKLESVDAEGTVTFLHSTPSG
jgi:stage V sporulation protein R